MGLARPAGAFHTGDMTIRLDYVAMLHLPGVRNGAPFVLPEGATVSDLLERLGVRAEHRKVIAPFVNEKRVHASTCLREGDRVFLALPVGGG